MILAMPEQKTPNFGTRLKHFRGQKGLTQAKLASLSGISTRTVQNAEAGITDMGASDIASVARCLGVTIAELLGIKKEMPTPAQALSVIEEIVRAHIQRPQSENDLLSIYSGLDDENRALIIDLARRYLEKQVPKP